MKRRTLYIILCFMLCGVCHAQETNDSTKTDTVSITQETIQIDVNQIISENATLKKTEKSLNTQLEERDRQIQALQLRIKEIEGRLVFADSIVARLSNDCLRKKYEPALVREALDNFSQMYSTELQSKLSPVKNLLQNYGSYYQEIITILQTAQSNSDLTIPSIGKKTANQYVTEIKNSAYYRKCYKKNWNIPFLEKLIDRSVKSLQEFDPMTMNGITLIDFK